MVYYGNISKNKDRKNVNYTMEADVKHKSEDNMVYNCHSFTLFAVKTEELIEKLRSLI